MVEAAAAAAVAATHTEAAKNDEKCSGSESNLQKGALPQRSLLLPPLQEPMQAPMQQEEEEKETEQEQRMV